MYEINYVGTNGYKYIIESIHIHNEFGIFVLKNILKSC